MDEKNIAVNKRFIDASKIANKIFNELNLFVFKDYTKENEIEVVEHLIGTLRLIYAEISLKSKISEINNVLNDKIDTNDIVLNCAIHELKELSVKFNSMLYHDACNTICLNNNLYLSISAKNTEIVYISASQYILALRISIKLKDKNNTIINEISHLVNLSKTVEDVIVTKENKHIRSINVQK